jgi:hypothetical protein
MVCERADKRVVPSSNNVVRREAERRVNHEAEILGGLPINDQLDFHGLLGRQVGAFGAFEELVDLGV